VAFIANTQGNPQKTAILISELGTVSKKDMKRSPPNPKPTPVRACPMMFLKEKGYFLSLSSL
jgi:hypothetical protein